jgi:hypothetical protein
MSPVEYIELEWKYSPLNFLEEEMKLEYEGISLILNDGVGVAKITPEKFKQNLTIQEELHNLVESRFHAVQIFNHKAFELTLPSRTDSKENGGKNYYLQFEPMVCKTTMGPVDIVMKDRDGNVKLDTKRDRIGKQSRYAELISQHIASDLTLSRLISSYNMSVKDPDNELVHLYEIRDALHARFGSQKSAKKSLNITKSQWDEISFIANKLPLKQGRHRGQMGGELREANSSELAKGRKSAVSLIEKYLEYIEE